MICASGFSDFFLLASLLLCTICQFLGTSVLCSQLSVAKVGFFNSFIAGFEIRALSFCMYRKSIFVSFVISYFSLNMLYCMSVFIFRKLSFLTLCRLQLKILITVVLSILIAFFRQSFRCPYRSGVILPTQANISKLGLCRVSIGCTWPSTLSQAKIYRAGCSGKAGCSLLRKESLYIHKPTSQNDIGLN